MSLSPVYVSVGSNIDRENMVKSCLSMLRNRFGEVKHSSVYESIAVGFTGNNFFNLVVKFNAEDPLYVIEVLKNIEQQHGRQRNEKKFAPRTLDLDLLLFGQLDLHDQGIDVPREEITRYAFVLGPLSELAPQEHHPTSQTTFAELWASFCVQNPTQADSIWPVRLAL